MNTTAAHFLLLFAFFSALNSHAQTDASHFRKGNSAYEEGKFNDAEIEYRKGLEKNNESWTGQFNLANSLYKQEKYAEAAAILDSLKTKTSNTTQKSKVYHNLGNSLLKEEQFEKSIEAYKESLKLNPEAEDTRYNLSYAYKMLKKQQQQQQQQQQEKQKEQDKNKQKQNDDQKQQEQKQNINRQEAERMLDALDRQEKQIRKEQQKKEKQEGAGGTGKDW